MIISQGRLQFYGNMATDGLEHYKILSPGLILKILRLKGKIRYSAYGTAVIVNGWIMAFFQDKKVVERHFLIKEDYRGV